MSDYTKTTNFTAKDSLATGDANKRITGALFDTEFNALVTAIASKVDDGANSTITSLTGLTTPLSIAQGGTASTSGAAAVTALGAAPAASPTFTGTVVLPSTTSIGLVSNVEIGYLDGVTSAIQTQLNTNATAASNALARANHTGTQLMSTISDAGSLATTSIANTDTQINFADAGGLSQGYLKITNLVQNSAASQITALTQRDWATAGITTFVDLPIYNIYDSFAVSNTSNVASFAVFIPPSATTLSFEYFFRTGDGNVLAVQLSTDTNTSTGTNSINNSATLAWGNTQTLTVSDKSGWTIINIKVATTTGAAGPRYVEAIRWKITA